MELANFDHLAAMPVFPEVVEAILPYLKEHYGNPSSLYQLGQTAHQAVDKAREQVAALIGAAPKEIIFTGSGSESNNLAIKGAALARQKKGRHIVVSKVEHYSVLHPAKTLTNQGFEVTYLPVDQYGLVNPQALQDALRDDTILVSIIHANNEIGTIQNLAEISQITRPRGIYLHTDAVASVGRIPVDVNALGVDMLSMSACQFYGPKGVGALYLRKGTRISPLVEGGTQEEGKRAGTYNVPGIVGMGVAAELIKQRMPAVTEKVTALQQRLAQELPRRLSDILLTGHPQQRLPGHVSLCVDYIEGESMLLFLDMDGICVASGSACTSLALKSSHVLEAIGVPIATAQGSMVISLGDDNTPEHIERFLDTLPPIVERLRQMSPIYQQQHKGGK